MLQRVSKLLGFRVRSPEENDELIYHDRGKTVPSDGATGYGTGCLFQHTDGGDGTALYVNEGDGNSANFNAITVA